MIIPGWRLLNQSTRISALKLDSNKFKEIQATTKFSWPRITMTQVRIVCDIGGVINRRWQIKNIITAGT